jgi:glycosyltransferase involved in cell wall biosynthesis
MKSLNKKALIDPLGRGNFFSGLGRYMATFSSILSRNGYHVHCVCEVEIDTKLIKTDYGIEVGNLYLVKQTKYFPKNILLKKIFVIKDLIKFLVFESKYAIVIRQTPYIPIFSFAKKSILLVDFPFEKRPASKFWKFKLDGYSTILCNSKFTASWIKEYWNRDANVIYPPIKCIKPLPKKKSILVVGRFQKNGRSKRQYELIEIFKQIKDEKLADNWCLILSGRVVDNNYFEQLLELADNRDDIKFYPDVKYSELENLYAESSLFWHACGYGESERLNPEKLEHFGIVVAEAMSAGCVPLVINKGGPAEIVQNEITGYHWSSWEELKNYSIELIKNEEKRLNFALKGQEYALNNFSENKFEEFFLAILNK